MVCHGGFSLDEATRRSWYNPEAILKELTAGMTLVDVGCGDGFFSILAAKKVGENGKVYAVDVDESAIEKIVKKAHEEGLSNIIVKVDRAEDTVFCFECADFILYSMNLHDFKDPSKVLANARLMIKPLGQLVDLDWKKEDVPHGPPAEIRFSKQQASELILSAGFKVEAIKEVGPYHYVIIAKPAPI